MAPIAHVTMGTLVDEPSIRPSAHIFVGSKAPWFEITDDLPQHQGHITGEQIRRMAAPSRQGNEPASRSPYQ